MLESPKLCAVGRRGASYFARVRWLQLLSCGVATLGGKQSLGELPWLAEWLFATSVVGILHVKA